MKYEVGQNAEFSKTISESDIYLFAGITGDFNDVHINEVAAKSSIFHERVAHGALVSALVSTVLGTKLPGSGTIYLEQTSKFLKPAKIGDTLTAKVEVKEIIGDKAKLSTTVQNQYRTVIMEGEAVVKLPGGTL